MPSSCLQPAISLTAAVRTTPTSWRISSCKNKSDLLKRSLVINARKRGGNPFDGSMCVPQVRRQQPGAAGR